MPIDNAKFDEAWELAQALGKQAELLIAFIDSGRRPHAEDVEAFQLMAEAYLETRADIDSDLYPVAHAAMMVKTPVVRLIDAAPLQTKLDDAITEYATISEEDIEADRADFANDMAWGA